MNLAGISNFVPLWSSGSSIFAFNSTQGNVAFFHSMDNGDTWENLNAPLIDWSLLRLSFPIYITGDSSVYRFGMDNQWSRFPFPEHLAPSVSLAFSGFPPSFLVFGRGFNSTIGATVSQTNVWQLLDNIGVWTKAGLPENTRFFWSQALLRVGNFIYIGSLSSGVWRSADNGITWVHLEPATSSVADASRPISFSLSQNYPNPFNPATTISYSLSHTAVVSLKIYDTLGREVATLLNAQRKAPGRYEMTFEAKGLSSGIYLLRLQAGINEETKKMLLGR